MGPTTKAKIVSLYKHNWSTPDIAAAVNATPVEVRRVLKRAGLQLKMGPPKVNQTTIREDTRMLARPFQKCRECGCMAQLTNGVCLECQIEAIAKAKRLKR